MLLIERQWMLWTCWHDFRYISVNLICFMYVSFFVFVIFLFVIGNVCVCVCVFFSIHMRNRYNFTVFVPCFNRTIYTKSVSNLSHFSVLKTLWHFIVSFKRKNKTIILAGGRAFWRANEWANKRAFQPELIYVGVYAWIFVLLCYRDLPSQSLSHLLVLVCSHACSRCVSRFFRVFGLWI